MSQTTIIVIAVIVAIALLLLFLVKGRKQHVTFDAIAPTPPKVAAPAPQPIALAPVPAAATTLPVEGHGVGSEAAAAFGDVIDQFVGIDAHPSGSAPKGHGDQLTLLKGLGPKAEAKLREVGVFTFDQIAAWNEADVAAIDGQMGVFQGRIDRDQWVAQAKLLAVNDIAGFEEKFGKLGG